MTNFIDPVGLTPTSQPAGDGLREVIIIGSGPAGYTAAVYAARANLAPLLFEGSVTAGGALMNTPRWRTTPGSPTASWARSS